MALNGRLKGDIPTHLTPRQKELMHHLCRGLHNKEIAREMGIAYNTVRGEMLRDIFLRLRVRNRVEAAMLWRDISEKGNK